MYIAKQEQLCWEKFYAASQILVGEGSLVTRLLLALTEVSHVSYIAAEESGVTVAEQEEIKNFVEQAREFTTEEHIIAVGEQRQQALAAEILRIALGVNAAQAW